MEQYLIWIIFSFGIVALIGAFIKIKTDFGPFNLRVIGIIIVATFATLLAIAKAESLNAAMGILGAIACYLFGLKDLKEKEKSSSVDASSSNFGDNAKLAGRDINETIEKMETDVANIKDAVFNQFSNIQQVLSDQSKKNEGKDYLVNTIYERGQGMPQEINSVINHWSEYGWSLKTLSSDFQGMDGIFLVFERERQNETATVEYYHGSRQERFL